MVVSVCYGIAKVVSSVDSKGNKSSARRRKAFSKSAVKEAFGGKEISTSKQGHSEHELPYSQVWYSCNVWMHWNLVTVR